MKPRTAIRVTKKLSLTKSMKKTTRTKKVKMRKRLLVRKNQVIPDLPVFSTHLVYQMPNFSWAEPTAWITYNGLLTVYDNWFFFTRHVWHDKQAIWDVSWIIVLQYGKWLPSNSPVLRAYRAWTFDGIWTGATLKWFKPWSDGHSFYFILYPQVTGYHPQFHH